MDQKLIDAAILNLQERQRAHPASQPAGHQKPGDLDEATWRELKAYLLREQPLLAKHIQSYEQSIRYARDRQSAIERDRTLAATQKAARIEAEQATIAEYRKRIDNLRNGLSDPYLHGPEVDIENPRLHQIGCLGRMQHPKGNQIIIRYKGEGRTASGQPTVNVDWERYEDFSEFAGKNFVSRQGVYANGKLVGETYGKYEAMTSDGKVLRREDMVVEDVRLASGRFVILLDTQAPFGLSIGDEFQTNQVFQVTRIEPKRLVELTRVDIVKLKEKFKATARPTTQP